MAWHGIAYKRTTVWYLGQVKWCACIVVIATNKSYVKFPVKNELENAMEQNKTILLSFIMNIRSNSVSLYLSLHVYSVIENNIKYLLNAITGRIGLYCSLVFVVFFFHQNYASIQCANSMQIFSMNNIVNCIFLMIEARRNWWEGDIWIQYNTKKNEENYIFDYVFENG